MYKVTSHVAIIHRGKLHGIYIRDFRKRKNQPRTIRCNPHHILRLSTGSGFTKKKKVFLRDLITGNVRNPERNSKRASSAQFVEASPDIPTTSVDTSKPINKTYHEKKKREIDSWEMLQENLFDVFLEEQGPHTSSTDVLVCDSCDSEIIHQDLYRCSDCNPAGRYCYKCIHMVHKVAKLHCVEKLENDMLIPVDVAITRQFKRVCLCRQGRSKLYNLIDEKGRFHKLCDVDICPCESDAMTLYRFGFWPLSPVSPTTAVSTRLLNWHHYLTLEAQISLQSFLQSINAKEAHAMVAKKELEQISRGESIHAYRVHITRKNRFPLPVASPLLCSACPKFGGKLFPSMDANFGLVQKHNSGYSHKPSLISPCVFLSQKDVNNFVVSYDKSSKVGAGECSNFQAGDVVRSKNQAKNLTYTGVFASVCKHENPIKIFNLCHGERLAYPVFMVNHLMRYSNLHYLNLHVLYDIACTLKAHFKKNNKTEEYSSVELSIPMFHCYGHKRDCQILLNPRRQKGFGLVDGEQVERLWSYLRPFSHITKQQTPSHREDLLAVALLHYNAKKDNYMGQIQGF